MLQGVVGTETVEAENKDYEYFRWGVRVDWFSDDGDTQAVRSNEVHRMMASLAIESRLWGSGCDLMC